MLAADRASAVREQPVTESSDQLNALMHAVEQEREKRRELASELERCTAELEDASAALERVLAAAGPVAERLDVSWSADDVATVPATVRTLESVMAAAGRALAGAAEERAMLTRRLDSQAIDLQSFPIRERALETRISQLQRDIEDAERERNRDRETVRWLTDERRKLAKHAGDLARSRAWRWGHGLTLMARRLTFRRSKRAGAAELLVAMLESPEPEPGAHTEAP
jgi:chromosome segregation ATPase